MTENYYEILGVSQDANDNDIKKAFRSLSLRHHPDRGGDQEVFKKVSSAYETLSDTDKRRQYDMEQQCSGRGIFPGGFPGGGFPGFPGFAFHTHHGSMDDDLQNVNNIFETFFNGMQFGPGGPEIRVFHNGGGNIFQNFQKPPPIVKNIKITLEQSYKGASIPIEIERTVMENNIRTIEKETIYINIPPGIDENEMIIMRDRGNVLNESIRGDIKIIITIENTTYFTRQGLDLIFKKTITLKEALCGFSFEIMHLSGKQLFLNNEQNITIIKPFDKKIIPNIGFQRDNNVGSMIIEFEVAFPSSLNQEQIDSIKNILT
jgi:DnaJ-class molecular chaperone